MYTKPKAEQLQIRFWWVNLGTVSFLSSYVGLHCLLDMYMYADRRHDYRTDRLWAKRILQSDCLSTAVVKCLFQCKQLLSRRHISVVTDTNILIV